MQRILLVDDEQNVLNALKRELSKHFELELYDSPVAALERSRAAQFDLVMADYRMPDMNGIEFLKQFQKLQPDASSLLLSGQADINVLIRSINETHVYRYLAKPWDKTELLATIHQALTYRSAIMEKCKQIGTSAGTRDALQNPQHEGPFRIVVVEGDDYLLRAISRGLTEENGQKNLYGAILQEINRSPGSNEFRCIVDGFHTAKAASVHIEKHPCDLVIASQTLPDMDGIRFLSGMRKTLPDTARILISSDPDETMLTQAINEAEVQGLLQLRWVTYELRSDARRQAWNLHQIKIAAIQALACRNLFLETPPLRP